MCTITVRALKRSCYRLFANLLTWAIFVLVTRDFLQSDPIRCLLATNNEHPLRD